MNALSPRGDIAVRAGGPGDLWSVSAIEQDCFGDPWPIPALLAELKPDDRRRPLVAEAGGDIVAYLMAWVVADEYHIVNLAVARDRRRDGLGTYLLESGITEARAASCRLVTLEVRRSNEAARGFYERHGFREVAVRPRYYSDNGEDALILVREPV